jgi:hypothetical protein
VFQHFLEITPDPIAKGTFGLLKFADGGDRFPRTTLSAWIRN